MTVQVNAAASFNQNRQQSNATTHDHDATLLEPNRLKSNRNTHHDGEEFQLDI